LSKNKNKESYALEQLLQQCSSHQAVRALEQQNQFACSLARRLACLPRLALLLEACQNKLLMASASLVILLKIKTLTGVWSVLSTAIPTIAVLSLALIILQASLALLFGSQFAAVCTSKKHPAFSWVAALLVPPWGQPLCLQHLVGLVQHASMSFIEVEAWHMAMGSWRPHCCSIGFSSKTV
jgi:hypothetical protein